MVAISTLPSVNKLPITSSENYTTFWVSRDGKLDDSKPQGNSKLHSAHDAAGKPSKTLALYCYLAARSLQ